MQTKSVLMDNDKEIKKRQIEILAEIKKTDDEIKKARNKKIIKHSVIVITILAVIKLFWGTIEIYNIFGYPANRTRFYKVTLNDEAITVNYNLMHTIPIIPFFINFNSNYLGGNQVVGDDDDVNYYADGSKKYIIDISSYKCYSNGYQVECKNSKQTMKKNNDTKYTNLKIVRTNNPYEELYNGIFIKDITSYIEEKGVYYIGITAKYSLVETEVFFYLKK